MLVIRWFMIKQLILISFVFDMLLKHIEIYNYKVIECKRREKQWLLQIVMCIAFYLHLHF